MGGKQKAPKGPKWKDLMSQMDALVSQNQDIFKQAIDFGKDQFSAGQEWVDKLSKYGLDQSGKLNDRATAFDKSSQKQLGMLQGISDQYGKTNADQYKQGQKTAGQITGALTPGITGQAELGQTLRDRYEKQGIPFEDKYLNQLRTWDSTQRREDRAAQGVADIAQSSEAARESELRRLESYGIDPSQTRSAALDSRLQAQNALAKAGAANMGRRAVEQEGLQYGANAVNIANQSAQLGGQMSEGAAQQGALTQQIGMMPGQQFLTNLGQQGNFQQGIAQLGQAAGQTGYNMAQGAGQFGMAGLGAGATQQNTTAQYGSGVYGQGSGILGQSGDMYNSAYTTGGQLNANDIQRVAANNANSFGSQLGGLVGTLGPALLGGPMGAAMGGMMGAGAQAGMAAFGGAAGNVPGVYRPGATYSQGGPVDPRQSPSGGAIPDDVPAMLTPNEYVIDPDTVRWFGEKHFSDLQKKAKEGITGIPADGRNKRKKAA